MTRAPDELEALLADIRACRACVDNPRGVPLAHEPRPVLRAKFSARLGVCSQAPGTRVHASGVPFTDPSGERLRAWMGVTPDEFYDESRVAIVPMGFCFPGLDANGSDLPPRKECAPLWRDPVLKALPHLELVLLVGSYAQRWHLPEAKRVTIGQTVAQWRAISNAERRPVFVPLPHPSWRNNAWVKRHPWFEAELLPFVRSEVRRLLAAGPAATSG